MCVWPRLGVWGRLAVQKRFDDDLLVWLDPAQSHHLDLTLPNICRDARSLSIEKLKFRNRQIILEPP
jgi:hypothetical protein